MKPIKLFFITAFLFTGVANAQITKGNWMVGGSGSFAYSKTDPKNTSQSGTNIDYVSQGAFSILLEPNIGYFIKDKLALALKINFLNSFVENQSFNLDNSDISISPNIRYYFLNQDKIYNLFIEPAYYYYTSKNLGNASGYGIKSGVVVFLNSSVGIEPSLNYIHKESDEFKRDDFFVGIGIQIHLEK